MYGIFTLVKPVSPIVIAANGENQQQQKYPTGFKVKKQTYQQQISRAKFVVFVHKRIQEKHHRKKAPEKKMRKQQWLVLRVGGYLAKKTDGYSFF